MALRVPVCTFHHRSKSTDRTKKQSCIPFPRRGETLSPFRCYYMNFNLLFLIQQLRKAEWKQYVTNPDKDKRLELYPPANPTALCLPPACWNFTLTYINTVWPCLHFACWNHLTIICKASPRDLLFNRNSSEEKECLESRWLSVMGGYDETEVADVEEGIILSVWNSLHVRPKMLFSLHLNYTLHTYWTWKVLGGVRGDCCRP